MFLSLCKGIVWWRLSIFVFVLCILSISWWSGFHFWGSLSRFWHLLILFILVLLQMQLNVGFQPPLSKCCVLGQFSAFKLPTRSDSKMNSNAQQARSSNNQGIFLLASYWWWFHSVFLWYRLASVSANACLLCINNTAYRSPSHYMVDRCPVLTRPIRAIR